MRRDLEAHDLALELMRSSRLDGSALRAGPRASAQPTIERPAGNGDIVALRPVVQAGLDIEAVLRARASIRHYAPSALEKSELSAVLRAAAALDAKLYPGETAVGLGLELLVAAWRVDDVTPALYLSVDDGDALQHVAALPTGERAEEVVLQREFAHAPALVVVLGNLAAAEARHGAHGHRLLLQRAGAAGHAGWLAAIAHGLDGTVFAGLLPDKLRALAGVDGSRRAQLLALSFGHPLSTESAVNQGDSNHER